MKNTLIVNRDEAVNAYLDSMMEHLRFSREDLYVQEFATDLKQLSEDITRMLSQDLEISREAFRRAFRDGYTMMMLPEQFDTLEKWSQAGEDFQVVVFTAEGKPVGSFETEAVQW